MHWPSLYDLSFAFFLLLTALSVAAAATSLIFQAGLSGGDEANWNVFIVVGSYFAMALVSLAIWISRRATVAKRLKTLPKPYVAVKKGDVPRSVSKMIADEYTRACVIVAASQPTNCQSMDGWGSPGTKYEDVHFRTVMLATVREVDSAARALVPKLPPLAPTRSIKYHLRAFENILSQHDPTTLRDYSDLIDHARFDEEEPTEAEWERCQVLVEQMRSIMEFYRAALQGTPPDRRRSTSYAPEWSAAIKEDGDLATSTPLL